MQWLVFSRLEPTTAQALEVVLGAKLAAFLEDHPDKETAWKLSVMARGQKGRAGPEGTKTIFRIDDTAEDLEDDPIAVTMMRVLLERCEAIEVDWEAMRQPGDEALSMLEQMDGEPGLYDLGESQPADTEPEDDEEGLFEQVLEAVLEASEGLERGMELKEAISEASPQARAWMEYVVRNNVRSDAMVDQAIGLVPPASDRVHREIEAMLAELDE
jgi:hypothetical protein